MDMFNPDFDPYETLIQMDQALQNQHEQIRMLNARVDQQLEIIVNMNKQIQMMYEQIQRHQVSIHALETLGRGIR